MNEIKIEEFFDGYYITHKNKDYKYFGKSLNVIHLVSEKVKQLMFQDMEDLKARLMKENHLS